MKVETSSCQVTFLSAFEHTIQLHNLLIFQSCYNAIRYN